MWGRCVSKALNLPKFYFLAAALAAAFVLLMGSYALAESDVYFNLKRTREALLAQRQELLNAQQAVQQQIGELQRRSDRIDAYLRDNDNSLRDVEGALRATK
jgi:septal ring factor EnvC (AmiA/AmiB activator)